MTEPTSPKSSALEEAHNLDQEHPETPPRAPSTPLYHPSPPGRNTINQDPPGFTAINQSQAQAQPQSANMVTQLNPRFTPINSAKDKSNSSAHEENIDDFADLSEIEEFMTSMEKSDNEAVSAKDVTELNDVNETNNSGSGESTSKASRDGTETKPESKNPYLDIIETVTDILEEYKDVDLDLLGMDLKEIIDDANHYMQHQPLRDPSDIHAAVQNILVELQKREDEGQAEASNQNDASQTDDDNTESAMEEEQEAGPKNSYDASKELEEVAEAWKKLSTSHNQDTKLFEALNEHHQQAVDDLKTVDSSEDALRTVAHFKTEVKKTIKKLKGKSSRGSGKEKATATPVPAKKEVQSEISGAVKVQHLRTNARGHGYMVVDPPTPSSEKRKRDDEDESVEKESSSRSTKKSRVEENTISPRTMEAAETLLQVAGEPRSDKNQDDEPSESSPTSKSTMNGEETAASGPSVGEYSNIPYIDPDASPEEAFWQGILFAQNNLPSNSSLAGILDHVRAELELDETVRNPDLEE